MLSRGRLAVGTECVTQDFDAPGNYNRRISQGYPPRFLYLHMAPSQHIMMMLPSPCPFLPSPSPLPLMMLMIWPQVMNDRRHILTKDAEGNVALWDVLTGGEVQSFGKVRSSRRA